MNLAPELNLTISDVQQKIKDLVKVTPEGEWLGGKFFNPAGLEEARWPTREELDTCTPDHPLMISMRGGHAVVVNSRALELAGITEDTPNPEGGVIEKDPVTGELTGVLSDVLSIRTVPPAATLDDIKDALARIGAAYVKTGVTSTGDAGADRSRIRPIRSTAHARQ